MNWTHYAIFMVGWIGGAAWNQFGYSWLRKRLAHRETPVA
jgi:hypothetical protein